MPLIQAVERALRILDLFDEYSPELKITEISNRMNLNKSTVHSLLKTLQKHHYIEQDLESGKYKLGMKLFERGNFVVHNLDIKMVARRHLIDLSIKSGHTIHLVVLDGKEGVYIDKVEGTSATILYSRIGRRVPIHCSAVGKVLVAFKDQLELNQILDGYTFNKQTSNTLTNEKDFYRELEKIRSRGYAIDNEENEPGVFCMAVPIRDHTGQVIAAISISMPSPRIKREETAQVVPMLKEVGSNISKQMGYEHHVFI
ncbi:MAG TPA: IclR family transcriptional regulator [Bacillales bacterium]|nr:IclR family transcriptional regulator [Bacillales bacterium]